VLWKALAVRNPITRGERREAKAEQTKAEAREYTPRRRVALDPAFVAMMSGIGSSPSEDKRPRSSPSEHKRAPSSSRETPDQAKARLAAWSRDHEKRGPP